MYRTRIEAASDDSLCYEIVRAITAVTGKEPTAVDPLFDAIDPDALEEVLRSFQRTDVNRDNAVVEFSTSDCHVSVYAHGLIEIRPGGA